MGRLFQFCILLILFILPFSRPSLEEIYGINFVGNWTETEKRYVYQAISHVSIALQRQVNYPYPCKTNAELFKEVFGITKDNPLIIEKRYSTYTGAIVVNYYHIVFYNFFPSKDRSIRLIVHELGHVFEHNIFLNTEEKIPREVLKETWITDKTFPRRTFPNNYYGYYGLCYDWQMSCHKTPAEEFADMFIGWTYDKWETSPQGIIRKQWMDTNMPIFINASTPKLSQCSILYPLLINPIPY